MMMRLVEVVVLAIGGLVLAVSSRAPATNGVDDLEAPASALSALALENNGFAQEAPQVAELLASARDAEPLACALMLRSFEFGYWGGSRRAKVNVPGDPAASVRDALDFLVNRRLDGQSAPPLLEALGSESDCEQRLSAALLGRIEDEGVKGRLRNALQSGSERARLGATLAVGYGDDHGAVSTLEQALRGQSRDLRLAALWALGRIESEEPLSTIEGLVADADVEVRQNALWALGQIESRRSVAPVTAALTDSHPGVRVNAAWALGQIESSDAIPALVDRLAVDPDAEVRRMIAWALGQIE